MKFILFFLFSITVCSSFGQRQNLVDSLSNEICKSITVSNEQNDSVRIVNAFSANLIPALANFTDNEQDSIGKNIFFRLQKNCVIFKQLLDKNSPVNKYWRTVYERPLSKLSNSDCLEFSKRNHYRYFEPTGDTSNVTIESGFWIDHFKNGTYSKLKIYWSTSSYFDIEFIESNNEIRKNFSNKGDKFRYTMLEKMEDCYLMSVEIVGVNSFSIFKMYF